MLTWCSSKPFDRFAHRVLRSSAYIEPADVSWRSCLSRLHHRLDRSHMQGWQAGMLGIQGLVWFPNPDGVSVSLCWLVGAGGRWRNDVRDMELFDPASALSCIRQRGGAIWSQCHS